jgi:hypothetical protein
MFADQAAATKRWHWQDHFSQIEQNELINWIQQADQGVRSLFGPLPYSYNVYFHRQEGKEPVPWAHTKKGATKSVHFYVNMNYSQQQFIKDWTASHELAHLLFPYIGNNSSWFSEGIASYLQYQIMFASNVISWEQGVNRLEERYQKARSYKSYDGISIVDLSKIFKKSGAYVRLYWGGAAYFNYVDKLLFEEKDMRLNDVIRLYLACCSSRRISGANNMAELFDQLAKTALFTEAITHTVDKRGFPETKSLITWLRDHPPILMN